MNPLAEIAEYHELMAETTGMAADRAGMAKGKGLNAQAAKHREWAALLRTMLPPTQTSVPRLRVMKGGG